MLFYYVCHRGPVNFNIYSKLLVLQYMLHFCSKKRRNDFLASYPTTKSRKIQSVDIGGKRSFMPLTQQSCLLEIASPRTKLILADFALLDPERFQDINSSNSLPPDAFENVARNYGFDEGKLKAEYISFIEIYPKLRKPKDDRPFNETCPGPSDDINRENFIAVLKVLSTFNLQSAFPELYTVYKILVTLPIGYTKCERTFSKLKFVKNNLRSTMGQKRLNSLMLINVERDLTKVLDYEQVINSFADTQLLQNMLRY